MSVFIMLTNYYFCSWFIEPCVLANYFVNYVIFLTHKNLLFQNLGSTHIHNCLEQILLHSGDCTSPTFPCLDYENLTVSNCHGLMKEGDYTKSSNQVVFFRE